jgi:hypothetical protein
MAQELSAMPAKAPKPLKWKEPRAVRERFYPPSLSDRLVPKVVAGLLFVVYAILLVEVKVPDSTVWKDAIGLGVIAIVCLFIGFIGPFLISRWNHCSISDRGVFRTGGQAHYVPIMSTLHFCEWDWRHIFRFEFRRYMIGSRTYPILFVCGPEDEIFGCVGLAEESQLEAVKEWAEYKNRPLVMEEQAAFARPIAPPK